MNGNVLFIVADDLNAWIGALGRHPDVQTPHIDSLAKRGILFTHAYCAAPYCNASRMSAFTGCLPTTTGIYQNEPLWDMPGRRTTFVETLREAGYYTFGAGKVFHGVFDYATAGRKRLPSAEWREIENRPHLWDDFQTNHGDPLPDGRPLNALFDFSDFASVPPMYHHFDWGPLPDDRTDLMPDAAVARAVIDFLANPPREPFFCAAGLYKPHLPWHVPARFFDLYDPEKIRLPLVKSDDLDDVPPTGKKWALSPPDHELVTSRGEWRRAVQAYLASISYCDHVIGQIVAGLDAAGLADRTSIILWGDNGFHLGEKLHWRKFVLWEEATRVPLIVVPPAAFDRGSPKSGGHRVDVPVSLIDLHPTILGLCEAPIDAAANIDGTSLSPLLFPHRPPSDHPPAIMTWGRGNHSVRTSAWRLIRYADGSKELYDHRVDSYEWTNLAGNPEFSDVEDALLRWVPPDR
jgi:arylsulfatase A-like enzyme